MSLMGIDIGTTGCKVITFALSGEVLAEQKRDYTLITGKNRHYELNPEEVWDAVKDCIWRCNRMTDTDPVTAFAVSAQGEAAVPVDRHNKALSYAPVSADGRGEEFLEIVSGTIGRESLYGMTGQALDPIHTLFKLLWWKAYEPKLYEKTWKFLTFDAFSLMKMGLPPVTDVTMAARTMCFDIHEGRWSDRIHEAMGLDMDKMPEVLRSGRVVGELSPSVRRNLGFSEEVVAVLGGHDQPCGALGAGIIDYGVAYSIGTTECLTFVSGVSREESMKYPTYPHVAEDRYVTLAGSQTGARLFSWLQKNILRPRDRDALFAIEKAMDSRYRTDVVFLTHLAGTGLYFNNPGSSGSIHGLTLDTRLEDILKAAHEGITFEQFLSYRYLMKAYPDEGEIYAMGGGVKSDIWMQIKSDIFQKPIRTTNIFDASVLGAAILAGMGQGCFANGSDAVKEMVGYGKIYYPQSDMDHYYSEKLGLYADLYERNN